jgi:plasmid stabilization system protein ParE
MYRVEWLPTAEQRLAEIWNKASDRALVAAAADEIDAALARNPANLGESRRGKARIAFLKPLAVVFSVDEAIRRVRVWDIWRWPR